MKTLALRLSALGGFAFGAALWFTGCQSPDPMTVYTTIPSRHTTVSIVGPAFHLNGKPTYEGRTWNGKRIQGLLMNSRMVQGIFDDRNPDTVSRWAYPDTGKWDPERNTREFIAAMPDWRRHGLLAFTINLQGGSPQGYSQAQPWHNSAIEADGSLRADYMNRLERILDRADALGMVAIVGCFYFGQDQRLQDEAAVIRAVDNTTHWLLDRGYRNVLLEINNECNVRYDHAILRPERVHELILRVRQTTRGGHRLLVGTSYGGGTVPRENVVRASDFLLMHGNGVAEPLRLAAMVRVAREVPGYRPMPILFNEDDHFDFDQPENNFVAAVGEYASWGYFDPGQSNYQDGYQCPPVKWGANTERKKAFFALLSRITGTDPAQTPIPVRFSSTPKALTIMRTNYHGWTDSILISNGKAEVIVVPAIGRVMQFRFKGEDGPFWENETLLGRAPDPRSAEWINFGGDKTWPAPQADWPKVTPRAWPPPTAFDSMPVQARVEGNVVTLDSPVDPHYGIRTHRRIQLHPTRPIVTISTTYEKVQGAPSTVAVWVITQLKHPVGVYAPVPDPSIFPGGYNAQSERLPEGLIVDRGLLTARRSAQYSTKIGTDADTLLWIGDKLMLRIDSTRVPGGHYPDQGSSAEIYTNLDPLKYVELELLGPLQTMNPGDLLERMSSYTLLRRTGKLPEVEARNVLGR